MADPLALPAGQRRVLPLFVHRLDSVPRPVVVGAVVAVIVVAVLAVTSGVMASGSPPSDPDLPWTAGASGAPPAIDGRAGEATQTDAPSSAVAQEIVAAAVVVHVAGAVANPGVHRLDSGARVADAVAAGGGPVDGADVNQLNLAAVVADGQRVYVPMVGEDVALASGASSAGPSGGGGMSGTGSPQGGPTGPLSLSRASHAELQTLPGVGPATADAIVEHRSVAGDFSSVDGLLEVRGIGPAKLEALRDLVVP